MVIRIYIIGSKIWGPSQKTSAAQIKRFWRDFNHFIHLRYFMPISLESGVDSGFQTLEWNKISSYGKGAAKCDFSHHAYLIWRTLVYRRRKIRQKFRHTHRATATLFFVFIFVSVFVSANFLAWKQTTACTICIDSNLQRHRAVSAAIARLSCWTFR